MSHRRRRALIIAASLATVVVSSRLSSGATFTWKGDVSSDLKTAANWFGGVLPGATDNVDFTSYASAFFNPTIASGAAVTFGYFQIGDESFGSTDPNILTSGGGPRMFSGAGTMVISTGHNIDTFGASGATTFDSSILDLRLTRTVSLYGSSNTIDGGNQTTSQPIVNAAAEIDINSQQFHVGVGSSSGDVTFYAIGADINITPSVDMSAATVTNRSLNLFIDGNRKITLTNGVVSTTRLKKITVDGLSATDGSLGTAVLGGSNTSNTWNGTIGIFNANLLINNNNSLGSATGYTEVNNNAGGGALELTGGITSGEYVYLDARNPTNGAQIHLRNISGNNTLSNTIELENGVTTPVAGNTSYGISSDGTAAGDILRLNNITSSVGENIDNSGTAVLAFRGAGNGIVNGSMTEQSGGTPVTLHYYSVEKYGGGTWTFAGSNSYTGATTVYGGTLRLASTAVHSTGFNYTLNGGSLIVDGNLTTSSVLANPGTVMGGSGTIHADTFISGAAVNPGDGGVGALTVKSLAFDDAANALNIDLGATGVDKVTVLDSDGLQFLGGAGTVIVNPTSLGNVVNGAYPLVDYNGTPLNAGSFSSFSLGTTSIGGLTLALQNNTRGTSVDLIVTGGVGLNGQWNVDANGNWTDAANWNPNIVPNGADQIANFGSILSNPHTVTLNSSSPAQTVGVLNFTPTGSDGTYYTIAGTGTLILNSSTGTGTINNASGSNVIGQGSLTLQLASNTNVNVNNGTDTLTIGAKITGTGALNKSGAGVLALTASNSFVGNTTVTGGAIQLSNDNNLGGNANQLILNGAALLAGTDLTVPATRNIQIGGAGGTLNANGYTMSFGATLSGSGTLNVDGDGTVSMASNLAGFGTVNKVGIGTLAFNSSNALNNFVQNAGTTVFGASGTTVTSFVQNSGTTVFGSSGTTVTSFVQNGGTTNFAVNLSPGSVQLTGGTMSGAGGVTLNTGSYDLRSGTVATPLNGSAGATISTGTVTYTGNNGYSGNTTLSSGVLVTPSDTSLGGGSLIFAGGTLQPTGNLTLGVGRNVVLNSNTSILYNNHTVTINGPISGGGGIIENEVGATLVLTASNSFTGNGTLTHGILRVSNSNAINTSLNLLGNLTGDGTLQLTGNITYSAPIAFSGRQGPSTLLSAIDNLSGNNTLLSNLTIGKGGGQYNFGSESGKLTMGSPTVAAFVYPTAYGARYFNLRGAGDYELAGAIGALGTSQLQLADYSTGNVTLSAPDNYRIGSIFGFNGGTITVASTFGTTETDQTNYPLFVGAGEVIHLENGSTLDLSNATSIMLSGAVPLVMPVEGTSGVIKGNVSSIPGNSTAMTGTVLSPGNVVTFDTDSAISGDPATPGGKLTFTNNVDLSNGGHYLWSLGTLTTSGAGTNYDQVAIGGNATLGGTSALDLDFSQIAPADQPVRDPSVAGTNAFWTTPHQWKIVDITGAGTNSTVLASINNFNNDSGPAYFKQTVGTGADAGDVFLNYAISVLGDANRDGKVNAIDFNILASNFGTVQQKWSLGDFDGDGTVTSADFTLLAMHFGQTSVVPAPGLGSLVPEPTSLGLLLGAATLGMRRRRVGK